SAKKRPAKVKSCARSKPSSEPAQKAFDVIEFKERPCGLAEPPTQFLENFAGPLDVDLVGDLDRGAEVRAFGALRPPQRIARRIAGRALAEARRHLTQHLLGHRLRPLAQLLERARLLARGRVQITLFERTAGA